MHSALEEKENEVQAIRVKLKQSEIQGRFVLFISFPYFRIFPLICKISFDFVDAEVKHQIDELRCTIEALENEKADMIEKLSQAKHQGVKAVRDEEEKKRMELMEEMEKKRENDRLEHEHQLQEEIKKIVSYLFWKKENFAFFFLDYSLVLIFKFEVI